MSCITSTYDASGKLVGCTEKELHEIISVQLYTVIALGAGLYAYKTFTAENWFDIAVEIGWGCVCVFTQMKRFTTRCIVPFAHGAFSFLKNQVVLLTGAHSEKTCSSVANVDDHCYVRLIKDGVELHECRCIHELVEHLLDHVEDTHDSESDDLINIDLNDVANSDSVADNKTNACDADNMCKCYENDGNENDENDDNENVENKNEHENKSDGYDGADGDDGDDGAEGEGSDSSDDETEFREKVCQAENHTLKFDFVLCQVPTEETATSETPMCMYTVKYDGFPRDNDGSYFYERKFVPVSHRMMEIVLHYGDSEYEVNLASPDNFYVLGNKLLDPAFLKWFVRKNHGVNLELKGAVDDATLNSCNYTIKCIDNNANLHTLQPCNYLRVCADGFEVHDSGLV